MPLVPLVSRDERHFVCLVTVELGWKDQGLWAFLKAMVAQIDGIGWRTGQLEEEEPQRIKQAKRKAGRLLAEVMRQNIPYLQQSSGTPIYQALSALRDGGWM
ncbi:UPF0236 family transposase-like protein [Geobacillus icigianus]|nr:UPF0236 family protein [Geobacillus subterraneus]